ncbi:hypothetical protein CEUSTIGMA_g2407.t1 [Chlamydomonas eustigma]|uniref:Saccharopine dehydrogenase NADP binding domain-containing protein n=1 Tax=Chlamydomonas eustigma TaxID=1157962 RepID=A0A250WVW5_9CHLO|nr:hypothetical protein CEUSTIGMA_g2407.t1 [Chlamydomonas eustigma]|eukprot:GAX74961.1 hypothetical protein CEUSTIGMA_g2407.t1 [Chlamydomonas eustigma]
MTSTSSRAFEIIVWGATGFTGKLVCQHIAQAYQGRLRWAIAGRDKSKLEQLRSDLSVINEGCKEVPILLADARDGAAMGQILCQTRVVLAMAGPYALYGDKVLEQCVEQGTHYCDITGETTWIKKSFLKYNEKAKEKGVKLVHCCGFDSIPSDLGTFMMVDYIKNHLGKKTAKVTALFGAAKGGVSGGTIASGMNMVASEPLSEIMNMGSNAYYLAELANKKGSDIPAPMLPSYIAPARCWAGPFIMEGVNGRIVHLSDALVTGHYGTDFKYLEVSKTGVGWMGWITAGIVGALTATISTSMVLSPFRALAKMVLPAPGQGPSVEVQKSGFWKCNLYAESEEEAGTPGVLVEGLCGDPKRDPGYLSTSRMVLEAGLCLALEDQRLLAQGCAQSGVMTAAAAMGMVLVERLRAAGFTWEVVRVAGKEAKTKAA